MSLRARLLAGMAVVSLVLVAVAFIIARTTEANLVDRVDQQLVQAGTQLPPPGGAFGGTSTSQIGPTTVYAARIEHGEIQVLLQPNVAAEDAGAPEVSVARAMAAVRSGDAFTVSSTSESGRYRVMALRAPEAV